MKKGHIIATALLAGSLLISGCAHKEKSIDASSANIPESSEKVELPSYLTFLKDNQIRFDIMNDDLGN